MHQGSCLCGAVKYEIEGELGPVTFCHCASCRKVNGTAFLAASPIAKTKFQLLSGHEHIKEFASSPGVYRVFCGTCGSPLFSRRDSMPDFIRLRIGTLDTQVQSTPDFPIPAVHIFVSQKAAWYEICDDAPQFSELAE